MRRFLTVACGLLLMAGTVQATDVVDPDNLPPAIVSLSVDPAAAQLLVGETLSLVVTGTFTDGSEAEITGDLFTSYGAQPETAASVVSGFVEALTPGDVTISIQHGDFRALAFAEVALTIRDPNDRDGDGLPDAYEEANGLDSDFAGDALADSDGDGLINLDERTRGTAPLLADTDGDGASDGLEVARGTDPTVADPPPPVPEQPLDEHCVVSALNRTAPVDADGVWVLPNVPANVGRVRVRATCVEDGVVRSGQSEFVTVPPNGVIEVAAIVFDDPQPIAASLGLSAPVTTLTSAGETVQVSATATLPGGGSEDRSAAASGTEWQVSNVAVATIDGDGLVTAVASGTVLVSATNEGALGLLALRVVTSSDGDGDGLPDDFEIANGLDPQDPSDALTDPDGDGLSILDEFNAGLDPFAPDSDDDGLIDGEEVLVRGTDPLRFDSDGDGVSDGLEVRVGSNPLDPESVDLTGLVTDLSLAPQTFTLIFNTVLGEASRQLTVTATLIDGTVLDVTDDLYGTTYESSDLTIASFGLDDGRVFAGSDGEATVTVRNDGFAPQAQVVVSTFSPQALSFLPLSGFPNAVDVEGPWVYVAGGGAGLHVVDASDPTNPSLEATLRLTGNANGVAVSQDRVYVAASSRLHVIDVTTPTTPLLRGTALTAGEATDVVVSGNTAFVAEGFAGLSIYDVSDPAAPVRRSRADTGGFARAVRVDIGRSLAYVADSHGGLAVIDISSLDTPLIRGSAHTRGFRSFAAGVAARGDRAWIADGDNRTLGGLVAFDVSDPRAPFRLGSTSNAFGLTSVVVDGPLALTSDYFFVNAVPIFNIEGDLPSFQAVADFRGAPAFRDDNGHDVAVQDGLVFLVGARGWLSYRDNSAWGNGGLHIGRYLDLQDDAGIPPTATIVAPAADTVLLERRPLTVTVEADDDVVVDRVELLLDGEVIHSDFQRPFEHTFDITLPAALRGAGAPRTLGARAIDRGGNVGVAEDVPILVQPDDDPLVEVAAPPAGDQPIAGTTIPLLASASDDVLLTLVEIAVDGVVQDSFTQAPFFTTYTIPLAATEITVSARAVDDLGQEATASRVVTVAPDQPPSVVILDPSDTGPVVEGSELTVVLGADDDLGIARVDLTVDGSLAGSATDSPYEVVVTVPTGVTSITLAATATDTQSQTGSSGDRVLTVIPDPGTTVIGRVETREGTALAGATVDCAGITGTSSGDGTFAIAAVPTVTSTISCRADGLGTGGEPLAGVSARVAPVVDGTTDVGPIPVSGEVLFVSAGSMLDFVEERLYLYDPDADLLIPVSPEFTPPISAMAFNDTGKLWVTNYFNFGSQGVVDPLGLDRQSNLLLLEPGTGEILDFVGPVFETVSVGPKGGDTRNLGVQDLAFDAANGKLYMLETEGFFGSRILQVDTTTGEATAVANVSPYDVGGLSIGADGNLYVLAFNEGPFLEVIDPVTGASLAFESIDDPVGDEIHGLALRPGGGEFLFVQPFDIGRLTLGPATFAPFGSASGAGEGILTGLDFLTAAGPPITTTVVGSVVNFSGPLEGVTVRYLGVSTTTAADGTFTLTDVPVRTSSFRVAVSLGFEKGISAALTPVLDGVVDAGQIFLRDGGPVK